MARKSIMRTLLLAAWVTLGVTAQDLAAQDLEEVIHVDGCVHMKVVHSTNQNVFGKRAVQFNLANRSDVAYYAKLNIGTPPQSQFVQLDTGSFELWVNPTCSALNSGDSSFCDSVGNFNSAQSSTFSSLGTTKSLRYGIGAANITYVKDDITLPGSQSVLRQLQFGVATSTEDQFSGILGIGYGMGLTTKYPNFLDELALQNVTKVKAFTIALGSKNEQEGVIVFGGVDTSKFGGTLARLPITPADQSPDKVPRYWVGMNSVSLNPPSQRRKTYANSSMQVFLDSGSTLTLLPDFLVNAIAADFGATAPDANGFFGVSCDLLNANGTLDFAFNGVTIRVPYRELIRSSGNSCVLGLQGNSQFVLLGDTFLRSAYVVFDLEANVVWMTQYTNCGTTPAALASAGSLATLRGTCTTQRSVNDVASPGTNGTIPGAQVGTGTGAGAGTPAAEGAPGGASTSPGVNTSGGSAVVGSRWQLVGAVIAAVVAGGLI